LLVNNLILIDILVYEGMFLTWQYQKEGCPMLVRVKGEAIWG